MYLGHRRFLTTRHPVKKKGKHFKGMTDHRRKPIHRTGDDIFGMVKDIEVIFGKGPGGQSVPNDATGHVPMWKKKIYILGATLLESSRCPLLNRRDARDEESLRETAWLPGRV